MELLLGSEVAVSSQLDVTSQQHLFLLGQNGAHFLGIMHQTQTQILVPDLGASQSLPSLLIQGSPDGVCLARQQLMVLWYQRLGFFLSWCFGTVSSGEVFFKSVFHLFYLSAHLGVSACVFNVRHARGQRDRLCQTGSDDAKSRSLYKRETESQTDHQGTTSAILFLPSICLTFLN